ncbi:MAG: AtpZ/AtpI family protein [Rickettsiales bacterium]
MKNNGRLPSLDKLQAKIDKIKKPEQAGSNSSDKTDMSQAVRLIIDLMAGVIMGVGFGYLLDRWLDTLPLFMIIGLFVGMAAGIKNMIISAKVIDKKLNEQQKDNEEI